MAGRGLAVEAFARSVRGGWEEAWAAREVQVGRPARLPRGMARLGYSYTTASDEPIGPIEAASRAHPECCFVLAAVDVTVGFTSHFICRGRARAWELSDRAAARLAAPGPGGPPEVHEPRVMQALLERWEPQVRAWLRRTSPRLPRRTRGRPRRRGR